MILILGGTTEGRASVKVVDEAATTYYYSTKGDNQAIVCAHGIRLTGGMNTQQMQHFCEENSIRLLIDAAHPFAKALHQTIAEVSTLLKLPVIRFERNYPPRDPSLIWCEDYNDAINRLEEMNIQRLLALSGVNTLIPLKRYWQSHPCWFRILDREESLSLAEQQDFPKDQLVFFHETEKTLPLLENLKPDAILTKESGYSGYFTEKTEAAHQFGIPVFVIKRPPLPDSFYRVYGEDGLRKQIERLLPDFFPLKSGYTTGSCATAAAKAALLALLSGEKLEYSTIALPSGEMITLPIAQTEWQEGSATCTVIKESGDDPDVTNHHAIVVTVSLVQKTYNPQKENNRIIFKGGKGVGTITLPGLGLEVGAPAINATPRKMICDELLPLLPTSNTNAIVTISVPDGEELAKRTFNPKLGIIGGISIIGTSGIVRPFSADAFIASIHKEASVAKAIGCETLIINSGAKSERFLKTQYSNFLPQSFIHYGNFIGETLKIANKLEFKQVILGIMIGKAVKLAEGFLDTHSKKTVMNRDFLQKLAYEANCTDKTIKNIGSIALARELWSLLSHEEQSRFFPLLLSKCHKQCTQVFLKGKLQIILISEEGKIDFYTDLDY